MNSLRWAVAVMLSWGMLSVAVQNALASTLVDDAPHLLHAWEGVGPPLGQLLHGEAPTESRLPLR